MTNVLNKHVLMLNKHWVCLGTVDVERALLLMIKGSAKGLCTVNYLAYSWKGWLDEGEDLPEIDDYVKTTSIRVPAPKVIILTKFDEVLGQSVKFSSKGIYQRDGYICQYCGKRFKTEDLSIDHVWPKSKGGENTWENCVTACFKCNNRKGDRSPQQANMKLLSQPYRPKWNPVFHIRPDLRPDAWKRLIKDDW